MTEGRKKMVHETAHRLRSRFTCVLLGAHSLRAGLDQRLTDGEKADFDQLDTMLEDARQAVHLLLQELQPELKKSRAADAVKVRLIEIANGIDRTA